MTARFAADAVLVLHLAFILWAVLGGLAVVCRPRMAWLHLPAVVWGAWIEVTRGICPLTPLENHFRALAGQAGYNGGFIEHYLVPLIYPAGLTPPQQWLMAAVLVLINVGIYSWAWRRWRGRYA